MSKPTILLFGNQGYASPILKLLLADSYPVIGLCTRAAPSLIPSVRARLGEFRRRLGLVRRDLHTLPGPFDDFEVPAVLAAAAGIPVLPSRDIKTPGFAETVERLAPDIILVAGFHRLVPATVYNLARLAAINLHPALLPRHRGGTPNRWVVRLGESETGITAHLLHEEFDTGEIVGTCPIAVAKDDTWGDVEIRLAERIAPFAADIVKKVETGNLVAAAQDESLSSYELSYRAEDRMIDWNASAEDIRRTCYAIRPKSGGLTRFGAHKLCIWETAPASATKPGNHRGELIALDDSDCPIVRCGDGAVKITHFIRGGRVVPAARIMKDLAWKAGDRLGAGV